MDDYAVVLDGCATYKGPDVAAERDQEGCMTTDEKLRLAVSVARAAAHSGEYRRLDKLIEVIFRKLNDLAPPESVEPHDREFKL
jgi:hypothetical protein